VRRWPNRAKMSTYLPARNSETASSFMGMSRDGPKRFQKYTRSGAVRTLRVNFPKYVRLSPFRTSIWRTRATLQMSAPTRSAYGKGRNGMERMAWDVREELWARGLGLGKPSPENGKWTPSHTTQPRSEYKGRWETTC
jgi:hypothetical protein